MKRRKDEVIAETPAEWFDWIQNAQTNPSAFKIELLEYDDFFNFTKCSEQFFHTTRPIMKLKSYCMIKVTASQTDVQLCYTYNGRWHSIGL